MNIVRDYIYKDIASVNEESSLHRVINTMKLHRISAVPVVNNLGEYLGCISENEILSIAVPEYMKSMYNTSFMANLDRITAHLREILNQKAVKFVNVKYPSVKSTDSLSYAADVLYRNHINILPVVEEKHLIGWISRIDILSVSLDDID